MRTAQIVLFLMVALPCAGQQQSITVQKLKGDLYLIRGGNGANTGAYLDDKEVLVIDAKTTADAAKQMIQEIGKLTSNPIRRIVLTHSDGDHVNGLNGFPTGLKIYAHPQTKRDMEEAAGAPNMQYLRDYLPTDVCGPCDSAKQGAMIVQLAKEKIWLSFFGRAHTSGDYVVYFPAEKVAFIGDLAFVGRDPLIHRQKGGTSLGYMETLKSLLAMDADTFVSGHNDPLTKQDLQTLYTALSDKREKVKGMIAEGKSLDEIKKAFGVQEPQPGRTRFTSLIEVMYLELTARN